MLHIFEPMEVPNTFYSNGWIRLKFGLKTFYFCSNLRQAGEALGGRGGSCENNAVSKIPTQVHLASSLVLFRGSWVDGLDKHFKHFKETCGRPKLRTHSTDWDSGLILSTNHIMGPFTRLLPLFPRFNVKLPWCRVQVEILKVKSRKPESWKCKNIKVERIKLKSWKSEGLRFESENFKSETNKSDNCSQTWKFKLWDW